MVDNYYPIEFDELGNTFIITNKGTAPTPCVVNFIPKVDFMLLVIEGLSKEPIKVSNIKAGQVLTIDGENLTVSLDEKEAFDIYDAWEFPKLQPGENIIKIKNGSQASISIEFNARYV